MKNYKITKPTKIVLVLSIIIFMSGIAAYIIIAHINSQKIIDKSFLKLTDMDGLIPSAKETPKEYYNLFDDKLWLHNVNSSKRLVYYYDKFEGFEFDVNYDMENDRFNVHHDNITGDESLEDLFDAVQIEHKYFWLDFKNLDRLNAQMALSHLNHMVDKYGLDKNKFIVESRNTEQLSLFTDEGFLTSFYIDFDYTNNNELRNTIKYHIEALNNADITYISADAYYCYYLEYFFPKMKKLFWYLKRSKSHKKVMNPLLINKYDTQVILNADIEYFPVD